MNIDIDYENPWMYLERPFTSDDVHDYYGFVYNITNLTNQRFRPPSSVKDVSVYPRYDDTFLSADQYP